MVSLRKRLLATTGAILLLFLLLTAVALDRALDAYTRHAEFDRLQGMIYSLLGATDIDPGNRVSVALDRIPAPRLQQPASGLSAAIFDADGQRLWRSPSLLDELPPPSFPGIDQWRFDANGGFTLDYGLEWLFGDGARRYTIRVTDTASPLQRETARLSHRLWLWLALVSALLVATLLALLYWGLRPLSAIRRSLDAIRAGRASRLDVDVPEEIEPLTRSLNELIDHQKRQQQRFRDALADLAHSLKTPLAVMRNTGAAQADRQLAQQLDRIDEIIGYQLKRAASRGSGTLTAARTVRPVVERLQRALGKVYADKGVVFVNAVAGDFKLRIDEDDLMELLGNLLDNAAKYGRSRVEVRSDGDALLIDDDGPGFPDDAGALLRRGRRADSRQPGQGIGLAVVDDITRGCGLGLTLTRSPLGGARVVITPSEREQADG